MLHIKFLGQFDIQLDGVALEIPSRTAQALFAYLVLHAGTAFRREKLAGLFWPDSTEANARKNLRTTLWQIRKAIGDSYIGSDKITAAFRADSEYTLDVDELQKEQPESLPERALVAALYEGELLPGFYEDWVASLRQNARGHYDRRMQALVAQLIDEKQWVNLLRWSERWVGHGQVPEAAFQAMMKANHGLGNMSGIKVTYERAVKILEDELGIEPSAEMTALYHGLTTLQAAVPTQPKSSIAKIQPTTRLPVSATPFIGRRQELAQLSDMLSNPQQHLITILGPGGMGKTRLGIEAARAQIGRFADGIFFIPLSNIDDAIISHSPIVEQINASEYYDSRNFMAAQIAEPITFSFYRKVRGANWENEREDHQLLSFLRDKEMLLVLDNFENVIDGVGFITDLLATAPRIKLLVTSRERLRLQGENLFTIDGLAVPSIQDRNEPHEFDAVDLFIQSAQRTMQQFAPPENELTAIHHICRLVDGMPLALELAAAWVGLLTVQEIADEINNGLDLLETSLRDVPIRQRSVRSIFETTWRQLSPAEQQIFERLSVFRSGFSRDAARQVTTIDGTPTSLAVLMSLVNKALLRPDFKGRYQIHGLLRQLGGERLHQNEQLEYQVQQQHSRYYATFLHERATRIAQQKQSEVLWEIEEELDNIRASWNWSITNLAVAHIELAMEALCTYYRLRGLLNEGKDVFHKAARSLGWPGFATGNVSHGAAAPLSTKRLADETGDPLRAILLGKLLARYLRFFVESPPNDERALQLREDALTLLSDSEYSDEIAFTLRFGAHFDYSPAERDAVYGRARDLFLRSGNQYGVALTMADLGWSASEVGEYQKAYQSYRRSLSIFEQLGNEEGIGRCIVQLGYLAWVFGQHENARQRLLAGLEHFRMLETQGAIAFTCHYLGLVEVALGDLERAEAWFREGAQIYEEMGLTALHGFMLGDLAISANYRQDYATSQVEAHKGVLLCKQHRYADGICWNLTALGESNAALGDFNAALARYLEALDDKATGRSTTQRYCLHTISSLALLLEPKEPVVAFRLATFVKHHPTSWQWSIDRILPLLERITPTLTSDIIIAEQDRATSETIAEITADIDVE